MEQTLTGVTTKDYINMFNVSNSENIVNNTQENESPTPNTGMIMDNVSEDASDKLKAAIENNKMEQIKAFIEAKKQKVREYNISRNDKCPCGSGKKYKNCCLSSGKYEKLINK